VLAGSCGLEYSLILRPSAPSQEEPGSHETVRTPSSAYAPLPSSTSASRDDNNDIVSHSVSNPNRVAGTEFYHMWTTPLFIVRPDFKDMLRFNNGLSSRALTAFNSFVCDTCHATLSLQTL
jgi:hypothetical protein